MIIELDGHLITAAEYTFTEAPFAKADLRYAGLCSACDLTIRPIERHMPVAIMYIPDQAEIGTNFVAKVRPILPDRLRVPNMVLVVLIPIGKYPLCHYVRIRDCCFRLPLH